MATGQYNSTSCFGMIYAFLIRTQAIHNWMLGAALT